MTPALFALLGALLHFVWQGALVGLVAWLALRWLAHRSAAARFAVLHGASWTMALGFAWTFAVLLGDAPQPTTTTIAVTTTGRAAWWSQSFVAPVLLAAWATGAAYRALRLCLGVAGVARWRRRSLPVGAPWLAALGELAAALGVRGRVAIAALAGIDSPMVVGAIRPLVLVPLAWAAGVPTTAMRAALAHELAHVLRHDYLLQLVQSAIESVLYFHPAVQWIGRRMRIEREFCCDDLATSLFDPIDYARGLAELEATRPHPTPALGANGASLMERIARLIHREPAAPRPGARRLGLVTTMLGLGLTITPITIVACDGDDDPVDPTTAAARTTAVPAKSASEPVPAVQAAIAVPWLVEPLEAHRAAITKAAARHRVDPSLLAIITWVESRGDADARSPSGARGLMQLMPQTAASIAKERRLANHDDTRLDDPGYNLDLGAYHLAQLLDEYGGGELDDDTIALAAAAYNGGRSRADAWLAGAALPEETARYKDIVVTLWNARSDDKPPSLD